MKQDHRRFARAIAATNGSGFSGALRLFAADMPRLRLGELARRLASLRAQAEVEGLRPAIEVADGFAAALARDWPAVPRAAWIAAISEAALCDSADARAAPLLMATVGVRLS